VTHPKTGNTVQLEAPMPEELALVLKNPNFGLE
jgi:hypothetical protein